MKKRFDLLSSFGYAFDGLLYAVKTQKNMRIHISMTVLVSLFGLFYTLAPIEWIALYFTVTFVIVCEMLNTAIEKCVDTATDTYNENAKIAKDVAAGSVVVASILAVITAAFLFLNPAKLMRAFGIIFSNPLYIAIVVTTTGLLLWWVLSVKNEKKYEKMMRSRKT